MCQKELWCFPDHQLEENSVLPRRRKGWLGTPAENRQPSAATQLFPKLTFVECGAHLGQLLPVELWSALQSMEEGRIP